MVRPTRRLTSEVMAAVPGVMTAGLPHAVLRGMVLTRPTIAEGRGDLFSAVPPRG